MNSGEIIIYQNPDGNIKIDVRLGEETVWLTIEQMAMLFGKGRSTIAEHVANVYEEKELDQNPTCRKFRQVRKEGARDVERDIDHYNLDVIISVGYRLEKSGAEFEKYKASEKQIQKEQNLKEIENDIKKVMDNGK